MASGGSTAGRPGESGVALVTGASSGIGAAFARRLHARGWRLALVARRAERLQALAEELGGDAAVLTFDLAAARACELLVAALKDRGLVVELLVNNAGIGDSGRFHEAALDRSLNMIDLNLRAVVELTRRLLPGMIGRGRGQIINVASTAAYQPLPYLNVYAASKAFVLSFTEALATELHGTGVQVQALCPGLTATEFQQVAGTDKVPLNRTPALTPDQVVSASLDGLDRGRLTVIVGFRNRLQVWLQGLAPRGLVRAVAARLLRPPEPPPGA